jgi:hypothetical protein
MSALNWRKADKSHILMFNWFKPVLYLYPVAELPETNKKCEPNIEVADYVRKAYPCKNLKSDITLHCHRYLEDIP